MYMQSSLYTLERAQGLRRKYRADDNAENANAFLARQELHYPDGYNQGQFVSPQLVITWLKHEKPYLFANRVKVTRGALVLYAEIGRGRVKREKIAESYHLTYAHHKQFHSRDDVYNKNTNLMYKPDVLTKTDEFLDSLFRTVSDASLVIVDVTVKSNLMFSFSRIESHANMLLLNLKTKTAEYFEPHGHAKWTDAVVEFVRGKLPPGWSFDVPTDTCVGPQRDNRDPGYCTAWCNLFLTYRLFYPDESRDSIMARLLKGGRDKVWERIGRFYSWALFWQKKNIAYETWQSNTFKNTTPWGTPPRPR